MRLLRLTAQVFLHVLSDGAHHVSKLTNWTIDNSPAQAFAMSSDGIYIAAGQVGRARRFGGFRWFVAVCMCV